MLAATPHRLFALAGCGNFRDLGGYETKDGRHIRWRRLFRSDTVHQLTAEDIDQLATLEIALATGLDLRSRRELESTGAGLLFERGAFHHHVPLIEVVQSSDVGRGTAGEFYLQRLEHGRACFAGIFETLASEAAFPAVFYCAAGKDRTGIVAAVLLRALGVHDEQIIEDYALTPPVSPERREARMRELGWNMAAPPVIDPTLFLAAPETMEAFLRGLDGTYGSVEDYLETCGITPEQIASVQDHLLE